MHDKKPFLVDRLLILILEKSVGSALSTTEIRDRYSRHLPKSKKLATTRFENTSIGSWSA